MSCIYYKNIKTRSVVLLIMLIISTNNLLGANFSHEESDYRNLKKDHYGIGEGRLEGYTKSILYRTDKNKSYVYLADGGATQGSPGNYIIASVYYATTVSRINDFSFALTNRGDSGIDIDFTNIVYEVRKGKNGVKAALINNKFGYSYLEYNGGINVYLKAKLQISVPAGTPDGTYTVGSLRSYIKNTNNNTIENSTEYKVQIITLPSFTAVESDIDFGRIPVDATAAQEAFGRIEFKINDELNDSDSFTATYPSTVNMTNSSDSSTVPLNIELLNGSETGPVLGTNFSLFSDTDIYVKATLPPSSITNKSTGIYSGSLTINIDYN